MNDRIAELRRRVVGQFDDEAPSEVVTPVSLRAIDLGDLLSRPEEPIPWAVPGWLAQGGTAILGGEPKLGKTTVAQDLAFAMATGGRWLDHIAVRGGPYRILYLDEENSERLVRRRLRQLAQSYNLRDVDLAEMATRLRYLNRNSLNLDRDDRIQTLWSEVKEFEPNFAVFDSLVRFHSRDENDNRAMADFFAEVVSKLSTHFQCGSILLHLAKPGKDRASGDLVHRLRGASDIVAAVDEIWTLEQARNGNRILRHVLTRWDETAPALTLTLDGRLRAQEASDATEDVILELLHEAAGTGAMRQEILTATKEAGFGDRATTKQLSTMWKRSRVRKKSEGKEVRYWISAHAPSDAKTPNERTTSEPTREP